jgi:predicted transposase YdaD
MELKWQYRSNFAKKYIGIGRAEGELEGEARGEARGRAEGVAKGKAEGVAKGKAEGVLAVLEARGLRVPKRIRVAVLGCTDLEQLDAWLRRAVSVEKASELLG